MKPRISIVTVSYNSAKTIEQTIKSVLDQGYPNLEYVIVDGASNDGTVDIIKKYAEEYPSTIKYVSEEDSGIYDAMNKGICMCSGSLIGIVNSDDYYEPNALEIVSLACNNKSLDDRFVVYGMVRFIDNEQEESIRMESHNSLKKRMMMHPACFLSKKVYEDIGLFDDSYRSAADYDLFLRIQKSQKVEFIPVYEILSNFRLGGMSGTYTSFKEEIELKYKYNSINKLQYYKLRFINFVKRRILTRY